MGSLYQRYGRWYIRYDVPNAGGKRIERRRSCGKLNKTEAKSLLAEIERSIRRGEYFEPSEATVSEYMRRWLKLRAEGKQLAPSTVHGYEAAIRRYIDPELGDCHIARLTALRLEEFLAKLAAPADRNGKGLSSKTVFNVYGVLHSAMESAVSWGIIEKNPMDKVKAPRVRKREVSAASIEEVIKLRSAIDKSRYRIPILIALATGMRRGEVCGLRWEDFDADRCALRVCRAMTQIPGQRPFPKDTKTGEPRTVPIPEALARILKAHRLEQLQDKLACGAAYANDGNWICVDRFGEMITPDAITRGFMRLRDRLGIPISFHGLRHTQATHMLLSGVPASVVAERLGHANTTMTLNVYGHVLPHAQQQAVDIAGMLIGDSEATGS